VVSALVHAPVVALTFWLLRQDDFSPWRVVATGLLPACEAGPITLLCEAFAVLLVFRRLRGERPVLARSLRLGVRRFVPIAVVAAILAVAMLAPTLFMEFLIWTDRSTTTTARDLALIAVNAIYIVYALTFSVAIPALLIERRGPFAVFGRSLRLTGGMRVPIFWTFVLFNLVVQIPARMIFWIAPRMHAGPALIVVNAAIATFLATLQCVLPIVVYHDLRETREGIGAGVEVGELGAVFD
jgi:hypothetical protein